MAVPDSLFKCYLLCRTVISLESLYNNNESFPNLSKDDFQNLLKTTSKEWILILHNTCYNQKNGVAMGSLLAPALANNLCVAWKISVSMIALGS